MKRETASVRRATKAMFTMIKFARYLFCGVFLACRAVLVHAALLKDVDFVPVFTMATGADMVAAMNGLSPQFPNATYHEFSDRSAALQAHLGVERPVLALSGPKETLFIAAGDKKIEVAVLPHTGARARTMILDEAAAAGVSHGMSRLAMYDFFLKPIHPQTGIPRGIVEPMIDAVEAQMERHPFDEAAGHLDWGSIFDGGDHLNFAIADKAIPIETALTVAQEMTARGVILLGGPTAARKSTVARILAGNPHFVSYPVDGHYKNNVNDIPKGPDGGLLFDHPDAIAYRGQYGIVTFMRRLLAGRRVQLPHRDFVRHYSDFDTGDWLQLGDKRLVVESIFAFHSSILNVVERQPHLKLFFYAPSVFRLMSRLWRDLLLGRDPVTNTLMRWGWHDILAAEAEFIVTHEHLANAHHVINTIPKEELERLSWSYVEVLAGIWAFAGQRDPAVAELLKNCIVLSLEADRAFLAGKP